MHNGRLFEISPTGTLMDPRITWAVGYIREHFAETITVPRLAERVNLSTSRFAHLFRRDVGVSPTRFLRAVRMARARVLLERTFLNVREVMSLVGCSDPSHFTREFREVHGLAPRAWRNAYGESRAEEDADGSSASSVPPRTEHARATTVAPSQSNDPDGD